MTVQTNRKIGWSFWLNWTVSSAMSWLGGYVLYLVGQKTFGSLVGNVTTVTTFFLTRYGYATRHLTWITVGGGAIGFIGVAPFLQSESTAIPFLAIGTFVGVIVGIVQWSRLRRWFYQAGWWIVASALAWSFGFATVFAPKSGLPSVALPLMAGAATGFAMMWLLNHPKQQIVNG